jgi:hypothetical protein
MKRFVHLAAKNTSVSLLNVEAVLHACAQELQDNVLVLRVLQISTVPYVRSTSQVAKSNKIMLYDISCTRD